MKFYWPNVRAEAWERIFTKSDTSAMKKHNYSTIKIPQVTALIRK